MDGEAAALHIESIPISQANPVAGTEQEADETVLTAMPIPMVDPQLECLIPPLTNSEYEALVANISRDGCREPLTIWKGHNTILDGHKRYRICKELDITFDVVEVDLPNPIAAKIWIINNQWGRRNLNESQRAMLAVALEALYAEEAKDRKGTRTDLDPNLDQGNFGRSAHKAADDMGVSHQTVSYAKKVSEKGIPGLVKLAHAGKIAVSAAARVTAFDDQTQAKIVERIETEIAGGKRPKVAAIIKEIAPRDANSKGPFDKLSRSLQSCMRLLEDLEAAPSPEKLAEMHDMVQKLTARLKEIETNSLDPGQNGQGTETVTEQPEPAPGATASTDQEEFNTNDEPAECDVDNTYAEFHEDNPSNSTELPEEWGFYNDAMNGIEEESDMHGEY
ncbi:MAG TPA: hypothetical protein PLI05_10410 [Methanotrichaceae archaeon]|nr:hypothetical protein [Methanotrichaceae archaeon]HQI92041.1 hypothetical protein [Methanotrichaceae archaeon]